MLREFIVWLLCLPFLFLFFMVLAVVFGGVVFVVFPLAGAMYFTYVYMVSLSVRGRI